MPATSAPPARSPRQSDSKPEPRILFQQFFKSTGPRTYAAQVKEASNGNHFIVLTEGRRDEKTDEVRKSWLMIFSEDFPEFFRLIKQTAEFVKANPVPDEVRQKREKYWARQRSQPREARDRASAPRAQSSDADFDL